MSTCISRAGEFSDHFQIDRSAYCARCGAYLDEHGLGLLRELFVQRLTVDSETRDRRRKDFNSAIFMDDGVAVFTRTSLDMVMAAFDAALEDLRGTADFF
jgi:hypothetical protein